MDNNLQKIFNNLSCLYKLFINKKFINCCFIFFGIVFIAAFVLFICALAVNKNIIKNIIWPALSLFIADLILFYIFEFIRRRCRNELISYFNFKNLYEENLLDKKIITTSMNSISNEQIFLKIHLESIKYKFENANLGKQDLTYSFYVNDDNYLLSSCYINNYNKKVSKQNDLQIILCKTQKIKYPNSYLINEDKESDSITDLKFVKNQNNISLYSSGSVDFNDELIKQLTIKINNVKKIGVNLDVRIYVNQIYFIINIENRLMLDLSGVKFYKNNLQEINSNYLESQSFITDILNIILND